MQLEEEIKHLRQALQKAETVQAELDRHVFHLKTLYDVSRDIYGSIETDKIIRNFLLMAMGTFGSKRGFVGLYSLQRPGIEAFESLGFMTDDKTAVVRTIEKAISLGKPTTWLANGANLRQHQLFPIKTSFLSIFDIENERVGFFGLGEKLLEEGYDTADRELLDTLVNNLVVALKNAKSFEDIWALNRDLHHKNVELEQALNQLTSAMRKVEILESVKDNLSKFVPITVSRMIEKSPTGKIPEKKRQDLSILFLDIEGYTRLCEKLGGDEVNAIIEKHFSVFMDAIHSNNGDVNETAGDGLMVLFLNEDRRQNAEDAVRAALTIQKETQIIYGRIGTLYKPLEINMGINSGSALVGAAKFDSYTGSRWTYTARGDPVNIAARIGQMATGGSLLISEHTAKRLPGRYNIKSLGCFRLKNISKEVEVFRLEK